jgi:succinoglycan biosynthesis transport protein ExoP
MSRIFDFLQQTRGWGGSDAEPQDQNGDIQQILSVLEPGQPAGRSRDARLSPVEEGPIAFERTEQVDLGPNSRLAFHTEPGSLAADRFRLLRMRMNELWTRSNLRRLLITSALPQDGKSTVALNLATALGEYGKKSVVLVDADLHRSSLTTLLNLPPRPGLSECLTSGLDPLQAARRLEPLGWSFLSAGSVTGNPTELLGGEAFAQVVQRLGSRYDWILFDSSPVVGLTDTLLVARQVDATLLVARAGSTPGQAIEEAVTRIGRTNLVGVVLNAIERTEHPYSRYQGYYDKKPSTDMAVEPSSKGQAISSSA